MEWNEDHLGDPNHFPSHPFFTQHRLGSISMHIRLNVLGVSRPFLFLATSDLLFYLCTYSHVVTALLLLL